MRIAFFNPQGNFDNQDSYWTEHPDFGGQLVYVKELALALSRQGHETVIFARRMEDPEWPEFRMPEETYRDSGVRIVRVSFGGSRFLNKEQLWPHLKDYVAAVTDWYAAAGTAPDVVTAHYGDGGIAGALFEQKTGVPFTFTAHSLGAQKMENILKKADQFDDADRKYQFMVRLAAERAAMGRALLRIVSTRQEKEIQYRHPLYSDLFEPEETRPFVVIPPGVNQRLFSVKANEADDLIRQVFLHVTRRDIDSERQQLPFAIASSRLEPKKNVTGLVEAYAGSMEWQAAGNLLLAVRGVDDPKRGFDSLKAEERQQMRKILHLMDSHQLTGKIAFINLNSQKALGAAYREVGRRGGVFCLTTLYEPFGLATIEAMSCGIPVVVTANGGGQEILKDGKKTYGILVDPKNPREIARGAVTLLTGREKWEKFRADGLERVRTAFTWDAAARACGNAIADHLQQGLSLSEPAIPEFFFNPTEKNKGKLGWLRDRIIDGVSPKD